MSNQLREKLNQIWLWLSGQRLLELARAITIAFVELIAIRKLAFDKPNLLASSRSQSGQESFAHSVNENKHSPRYLEIGAGHPVESSNTYILETQMGWTGLSWDLSSEYAITWNTLRRNKLVCEDARLVDWSSLLTKYGTHFDYLSLDINSVDYEIEILEKLFKAGLSFSSLTVEHDSYVSSTKLSSVEFLRELLIRNGYKLVCKDVKFRWRTYEDWWVGPEISESIYKKFLCDGMEGKFIFSKFSYIKHVSSIRLKAF